MTKTDVVSCVAAVLGAVILASLVGIAFAQMTTAIPLWMLCAVALFVLVYLLRALVSETRSDLRKMSQWQAE